MIAYWVAGLFQAAEQITSQEQISLKAGRKYSNQIHFKYYIQRHYQFLQDLSTREDRGMQTLYLSSLQLNGRNPSQGNHKGILLDSHPHIMGKQIEKSC